LDARTPRYKNNEILIKINISLFLYLILFGCDQPNKINELTTYNNKICSKQSVELNGYSYKECIRGCRILPDYYYKIAFITKSHGIFVTKYAYSVSLGSDYTSQYETSKDRVTCQDTYSVINIYNIVETKNFINEILNNTGDEYKDYYCCNNIYKYQSCEVFLSEKTTILYLTKCDFKSFMQEYPDTRIMKY
jgi:hypothetical protein